MTRLITPIAEHLPRAQHMLDPKAGQLMHDRVRAYFFWKTGILLSDNADSYVVNGQRVAAKSQTINELIKAVFDLEGLQLNHETRYIKAPVINLTSGRQGYRLEALEGGLYQGWHGLSLRLPPCTPEEFDTHYRDHTGSTRIHCVAMGLNSTW